jgi:hypothetical protein
MPPPNKSAGFIPKWAILFILILISLFGLIYIITRLLGLPLSGEYISPNIKTSKKNGSFIAEYITPSNPYKINDSLKVSIKEAWLEKDCFYDGKSNIVSIQPQGYKLLINGKENDLKGEGIYWRILTKDNRYFYGENGIPIIQDFDSPLGDTLEYRVENNFHIAIGKFILVKRKN